MVPKCIHVVKILQAWQNFHFDYLAYGIRILAVGRQDGNLWYLSQLGQDIELKKINIAGWITVIPEYLQNAGFMFSIMVPFNHFLSHSEKQDGYWKLTLDFNKLNQIAILISMAVLNVLYLLEQNNMASDIVEKPFIKHIFLYYP